MFVSKIHSGLRTIVVYMGDRYGDSLNLAKTELYSTDASRSRKVPVTSARQGNKKARLGDRNRFIKPETQGTQTRTPIRSNRQIASSETRQQFVALDSRLEPLSFDNDPSAGSPTETLLRLLLPLDDQV